MVESKPLRPDADHAPAVEQDDADCDRTEHGLRSELVSLLDEPKGVYTDGLRSQSFARDRKSKGLSPEPLCRLSEGMST